ncbi:hypothetical protein AB0I72_03080 [Nocardiopsis sp. NPDC049922]|uniref:hypothetical protein n=1 Tax=Nocardiopsis sp. NPDC049922 TaxID=3155157 RepID=UPI0033E51A3D
MRRLDESRRCQHEPRLYAVGGRGRRRTFGLRNVCSQAEGATLRVAGRSKRLALLDDLRRLASYLEANPDLPVGEMTRVEIVYFTEGCDGHQQDEVARLAGVMEVAPRWEGDHYVTEKRIGQAGYRVVSIPENTRVRERPLRGSR